MIDFDFQMSISQIEISKLHLLLFGIHGHLMMIKEVVKYIKETMQPDMWDDIIHWYLKQFMIEHKGSESAIMAVQQYVRDNVKDKESFNKLLVLL